MEPVDVKGQILGALHQQVTAHVLQDNIGMVVVVNKIQILHLHHPKAPKKHAAVVLVVPGRVLLVTVLLYHRSQLLHLLLLRVLLKSRHTPKTYRVISTPFS